VSRGGERAGKDPQALRRERKRAVVTGSGQAEARSHALSGGEVSSHA